MRKEFHPWGHEENSLDNYYNPELNWEDAWDRNPKMVIDSCPPEFGPKECWICWILDLRISIFIQKKRKEGY